MKKEVTLVFEIDVAYNEKEEYYLSDFKQELSCCSTYIDVDTMTMTIKDIGWQIASNDAVVCPYCLTRYEKDVAPFVSTAIHCPKCGKQVLWGEEGEERGDNGKDECK